METYNFKEAEEKMRYGKRMVYPGAPFESVRYDFTTGEPIDQFCAPVTIPWMGRMSSQWYEYHADCEQDVPKFSGILYKVK